MRRRLVMLLVPVLILGFPMIVMGAVLLMGAAVLTARPAVVIPGLSQLVAAALQQAETRVVDIVPGCKGMTWSLLAGIAQVESGLAQGHEVDVDGTVWPKIIGPRLDGSGAGGNTTAVRDTDNGIYDQDWDYDRAVGPFQFLPSTWRIYRQNANGDDFADPQNLYDSALTAAVYLCGKPPRDLTDPAELEDAILTYNHSSAYVAKVLQWKAAFEGQAGATATLGGDAPAPYAGGGTGCTVPDPTGTGGCVTAATAWMLGQVRARIFTGPASCWDAHEWNPKSDHPKGKACDFTIGKIGKFPSGAVLEQGWQLARWVQTYAAQLKVAYVIFQGKIWSAEKASQGWRPYNGGGVYDPKSPTGGHYDHVHVSVTE